MVSLKEKAKLITRKVKSFRYFLMLKLPDALVSAQREKGILRNATVTSGMGKGFKHIKAEIQWRKGKNIYHYIWEDDVSEGGADEIIARLKHFKFKIDAKVGVKSEKGGKVMIA